MNSSRKSAKEVAETVHDQFARQEWLMSAPSEEICEFISYYSPETHAFQFARAALDVRLSKDADIHSRRIVHLTWVLVVLTGAILFYTVVLYQDAHTEKQRDHLQENHNAQHP